ncbi:MAG: 30S ribosomal protein S17e [Nanoarchaeota archaeon]|nr:30S ribosomal protein S17e [DPANN group archaeon]MBL7116519.1 30S ribosomal protein S17e [Nanoarchaeota archaeon]
MGRIKTQLVKSVTHKLMKEHGEEFTEEFNKNKGLVNELTDVESKKIRNIIAGYITRMKKSGG